MTEKERSIEISESSPKKPGDKHHICFLGDSFTYGHGIPELRNRFSNLVGDNLENKFSGKYVVSNLADAGRDLLWVKAVLMECFESNYRIDTVVYVMCLNDIEMFHRDRNKFYQDIAKFQPKFFLFRDTYFFNLFYIRMRLFSQPEVSGYYSMLVDYYKGQPWQAMCRKLSEVHNLCDRNNAKLKVVVFPFVQQFPTEYPFAQAHRKAVRFCEDRKIPVLDLGPVLLPAARPQRAIDPSCWGRSAADAEPGSATTIRRIDPSHTTAPSEQLSGHAGGEPPLMPNIIPQRLFGGSTPATPPLHTATKKFSHTTKT